MSCRYCESDNVSFYRGHKITISYEQMKYREYEDQLPAGYVWSIRGIELYKESTDRHDEDFEAYYAATKVIDKAMNSVGK